MKAEAKACEAAALERRAVKAHIVASDKQEEASDREALKLLEEWTSIKELGDLKCPFVEAGAEQEPRGECLFCRTRDLLRRFK